jgi:hypothetical protein
MVSFKTHFPRKYKPVSSSDFGLTPADFRINVFEGDQENTWQSAV